MAKKMKNNQLLHGGILACFGVALFLMAFLPAYIFVRNIGSSTYTTASSFYYILKMIFQDGFTNGDMMWIQILTLAYFVVALISMVLGCLMILNVLKSRKIVLATYLLAFVVLLAYLITFFVFKGEGYMFHTLLETSSYRTWLYVPLGVSALTLGYSLYSYSK